MRVKTPKTSTSRLRNSSIAEVDACLRETSDFLSALRKDQISAQQAEQKQDADAFSESTRLFMRDLRAFLAAGRTVRNFLIQLSNATGSSVWVLQRLEPSHFEFHMMLANQTLHDHSVELAPMRQVAIAVNDLSPYRNLRKGDAVTFEVDSSKISPPQYVYIEDDLEPAVKASYAKLPKARGNRERTVVELASEFLHGLQQIAKNANRNSRFSMSKAHVEVTAARDGHTPASDPVPLLPESPIRQ